MRSGPRLRSDGTSATTRKVTCSGNRAANGSRRRCGTLVRPRGRPAPGRHPPQPVGLRAWSSVSWTALPRHTPIPHLRANYHGGTTITVALLLKWGRVRASRRATARARVAAPSQSRAWLCSYVRGTYARPASAVCSLGGERGQRSYVRGMSGMCERGRARWHTRPTGNRSSGRPTRAIDASRSQEAAGRNGVAAEAEIGNGRPEGRLAARGEGWEAPGGRGRDRRRPGGRGRDRKRPAGRGRDRRRPAGRAGRRVRPGRESG
jgi:hypothetical protein